MSLHLDDLDGEAVGRQHMERAIVSLVAHLREAANTIEKQAKGNIEKARSGENEWESYGWAAAKVVQTLCWRGWEANLPVLIEAASDADRARTAKRTAAPE